jgi:hypothetical protein
VRRLYVDTTNADAWDMEGNKVYFHLKFVVDFRQKYVNMEKKKVIIPQN